MLENIQSMCREQGIKISQLERDLGFGRGSIYKWDKNSPSIDKLQKVANYFKVTVDAVIGWGNIFGIGWTIKDEREFQGLTKEELAQKGNISVELLSQIEENIVPNASEQLKNITDVFAVTVQEFLIKYEMYDEAILQYYKGDAEAYLKYRQEEEIRTKKNKEPYYALNDKDERDIAKDLERIMSNLDSNHALAFYGEEAEYDEEAKEMLRVQLEQTMRMAKQMAKQKFTPKKYRNE